MFFYAEHLILEKSIQDMGNEGGTLHMAKLERKYIWLCVLDGGGTSELE